MAFLKLCAFLIVACAMVQEATPFSIGGGGRSPQRQEAAVVLRMAGFGAGGGSSSSSSKKNKKKKKGGSDNKKQSSLKLKPKSQWDRYNSLKDASPVKVAVRVATPDESGTWFEVGFVKSEGNDSKMAVTTQRGIIAEHAKRMHPLQLLPSAQVEWAFAAENSSDESSSDGDGDIVWVAVDKNGSGAPPAGMEKKVGFEGSPEPSGFYSKGLIGSNGPVVAIGNQRA